MLTFCGSFFSVEYLGVFGLWMTAFEKTSVFVSSTWWNVLCLTAGKKQAQTVAKEVPKNVVNQDITHTLTLKRIGLKNAITLREYDMHPYFKQKSKV